MGAITAKGPGTVHVPGFFPLMNNCFVAQHRKRICTNAKNRLYSVKIRILSGISPYLSCRSAQYMKINSIVSLVPAPANIMNWAFMMPLPNNQRRLNMGNSIRIDKNGVAIDNDTDNGAENLHDVPDRQSPHVRRPWPPMNQEQDQDSQQDQDQAQVVRQDQEPWPWEGQDSRPRELAALREQHPTEELDSLEAEEDSEDEGFGEDHADSEDEHLRQDE